jgi:hypothetical protein
MTGLGIGRADATCGTRMHPSAAGLLNRSTRRITLTDAGEYRAL